MSISGKCRRNVDNTKTVVQDYTPGVVYTSRRVFHSFFLYFLFFSLLIFLSNESVRVTFDVRHVILTHSSNFEASDTFLSAEAKRFGVPSIDWFGMWRVCWKSDFDRCKTVTTLGIFLSFLIIYYRCVCVCVSQSLNLKFIQTISRLGGGKNDAISLHIHTRNGQIAIDRWYEPQKEWNKWCPKRWRINRSSKFDGVLQAPV